MPRWAIEIPLTPYVLRLLEHIHGHLGWLVAAALVHPAIVLRRPKRRAHLAVALPVGMVTIVFAVGCWIYVYYRERLRQSIFLQAPSIGLLLERKEHLGFAAFALAWAGALAYAAAFRVKDEKTMGALRKTAHWAFVAAAALAVVVATLGTIVATYKSF